MNKRYLFFLLVLLLQNICSGQTNQLEIKKVIGKYQIIVEELPNYSFNTFMVDTITGKKYFPGEMLYSKYLNIGNFLYQDSVLIFIAEASRMSDPSGNIELVRLKIDSTNIIISDHFSLYGAINPNGLIVREKWYCNREFKIIDQNKLECIENWWMLKINKSKEQDNLKTVWKIDYPNKTIIKISETKIE